MRYPIRSLVALALLACITSCAHRPKEGAHPAVDAHSLVGPTWAWSGTVTPVEVLTPADPASYTFQLSSDGHAAVRADCNRGSCSYTLSGSELRFGPMALTRAMCAEGSLDTRFAQQLGGAAHTFWSGDTLMIDLIADSGTMRFLPAR